MTFIRIQFPVGLTRIQNSHGRGTGCLHSPDLVVGERDRLKQASE